MTKTSSEPCPSGPLGTVQALEAGQLRWTCGQECFPFETTHEVEPIEDVVGQDPAVESLRFGLETDAPGQNIFVRGITGSGRLSMVQRLLASIQPACSPAPDFCFVHRFHQPDRPRLITLPRRDGLAFEAAISDLVSFIRDELAPALSSELLRARQSEVELEARDPELAKNTTKVLELVNEISQREGYEDHFDTIGLFLPTCPFRTSKHIIQGLRDLSRDVDSIVSLTTYEFPPQLCTTMDGDTGFTTVNLIIGAAGDLIATGYYAPTSAVDISYTAATAATDHSIYIGDLNDVGTLTLTDQDCGIGTSGAATFVAGTGSKFFLVVGNDGENEGSYGTDGYGAERTVTRTQPPCVPQP